MSPSIDRRFAGSCLGAAALLASAVMLAAPAAQAGTVVFTSNRCPVELATYEGTCLYRLWRVNDDGTGLRVVTSSEGADYREAAPAWSPDGRWIVYVKGFINGTQLWVTSADGSTQRPISPRAPHGDVLGYHGRTDWSPDGSRIAVQATVRSGQGGKSSEQIYVMSPDGSGARQVTSGDQGGEHPSFSADGRHILVKHVSVNSPDPADIEVNLYRVSVAGEPAVPITLGGLSLRWIWGFADFGTAPQYSPDGNGIALPVEGRLYTLSPDTGRLEDRTPPGIAIGDIAWADGGRAVTYTTQRSGGTLAHLDLALGLSRPVTLAPPAQGRFFVGDSDPDWTGGTSLGSTLRGDSKAPAVDLVNDRTGRLVREGAASASRTRKKRAVSVPLRAVRLFAIDLAGVRQVKVALVRRSRRPGRESLCRFLGTRRFGKRRPCSKPRYLRVRNDRAWRRMIRRVKPGNYEIWSLASDRQGNQARRPTRRQVRLLAG